MNYGMDYQGGGGGGGFAAGGGGGFGGGGGTPMGATPSSSGGRSGGGGGGRKSYDEQTLQPVTVSMCLRSQSDADGSGGMQLPDGRKLYHVKIVGAVRSFENYSTNIQYEIEDGTGLIDVKQWLDNNDCSAMVMLREACAKDHIYLAIIGQIKDYDGKKMIVADSIRPISTGNELTHHMLEVVYTAEKLKQQNSYVSAPPPMMNTGIGFGVGGGAPVQQQQQQQSGSNVRDAVLHFIRTEGEMNDNGANVQVCIGRLQGTYSEPEIRKVIETLAAEGHIYSTIDENNYRFAM